MMVDTQKPAAQFDSSQLQEAVAKFHAELAAGEKEAANAMIQAYGESWLKVQSELDQLLATMPDGGADATWLFEYGRLASIQEQVEAQLRRFAKFAEANIISQQSVAVQAAQTHAAELMVKAFELQQAPGEIYAILAQVPEAAVEDLVGFLSDGSPLHDLLAELGPDASAEVRRALITGVTTGQGPMEIAQRVRSAFSEGLVRALRISRTEQMRAYREASHRKFEAAKDINEGWIWYSALRTNTCAACWAMHGTIHPLDQRLDDHVNGQCTPLPKTKHWKEILGQAGEGIEETTVQVPRGADLFKKLPKEKQIKILGPAKYHAWKKGEIELEDLVARRHDPKWGTMRYTASLKIALQNASLRKAKAQATVQAQSQLLGTPNATQAKKIEEEAAAAAAKIKAEVRAEAKAQAAAEKKSYQKVNSAIQGAKAAVKGKPQDKVAWENYKAKLADIEQKALAEGAPAKALALIQKNKAVADAKLQRIQQKEQARLLAKAAKAKKEMYQSHKGLITQAITRAKAKALAQPPAPKGKTYQQYNSAVQSVKATLKKKGNSPAVIQQAEQKLQALLAEAKAQGNTKAAALIQKNIAAVSGAAAVPLVPKPVPMPKPQQPPTPVPPTAPQPKPPPTPGLGNRVFPYDKTKLVYDPNESQLGGAHRKQVFRDANGNLWLFKPQDEFRAELDVATARIQARAGLQAPETYLYTDESGQVTGSIQKLFGSKATRRPAFGQGSGFDPTKLDAKDTFEVQKHAALDWMIGNHDGHKEQFVKVKGGGGQLIGVDKGQAFKFWGKDQLDYTYAPNSNVGVNSVYNQLHEAWAKGKDLPYFHDLTTPGGVAYRDAIQRMMDIPDDEYKEILRPYAEKAARAGFLAVNSPTARNKPEQFLKEAVQRKNNLLNNLLAYHDQLAKERAKALQPAAAPVPPGLKGMQGAKVFYTNRDGIDWAKQQWGTVSHRLTPQQRAALEYYTGSGYVSLNRGLRTDPSKLLPTEKHHVRELDAVLQLKPIPEDVIVWRGVDNDTIQHRGPRTLVGKTITDAGYLSTSVGATLGFASKPIYLRIRAPAGTPAYFVYLNSSFPSERELLLGRSQHLYVHSVKQQGGRWIMDVEIVPPGTNIPGSP